MDNTRGASGNMSMKWRQKLKVVVCEHQIALVQAKFVFRLIKLRNHINSSLDHTRPPRKLKIPVLVEATTAIFTDMLSPDCPQSAKALRSGNVSYDTNNNHWWSLQDGNSLYNFFLVNLCWEDRTLVKESRDETWNDTYLSQVCQLLWQCGSCQPCSPRKL